MFCFESARPATFEMSASSVGSTRSSASNSSTCVPMRPYAEAISAPDAPAPITAMRLGSSSSAHASSVPITRPPKLVPGTGLGIEPVAITTFLASNSWSPTLTFPAGVSDATPSITSTWFFFIRPPTPPVSVLITLRRRSPTAAKSIERSGTRDAEVRRLVDLGDDVGDAEDRLRRDARVVEAATADDVLLDDGRLEAELGRADRRHVPPGSGSDDDAVVSALGHGGA